MIEVEKKFILSPENEKRLLKGAEFLNARTFTDVYYDSDDYTLTTHDIWLRARDGKWELKVSLYTDPHRFGDQYEEIEDEARIREKLHVPAGKNLEHDLALAGYAPFCTITTLRRKYKKGPFTIDLDEGRWEDAMENGVHALAEIELMVNDASEADGAFQSIKTFAEQQGLTFGHVRGKAVEYLKKVKPRHFRALVEAGVVRDC